ncbi:MAG: hypothetical protein ACKPBU_02045 [Alphaproteobacteria bacterium]
MVLVLGVGHHVGGVEGVARRIVVGEGVARRQRVPVVVEVEVLEVETQREVHAGDPAARVVFDDELPGGEDRVVGRELPGRVRRLGRVDGRADPGDLRVVRRRHRTDRVAIGQVNLRLATCRLVDLG